MTLTGHDFYDRVNGHETLRWLGVTKRDEIAIQREPGVIMCLKLDGILGNTWGHIENVLLGKVNPDTMIHLSRIVGYYSRISNWNASKIAELNDRHKGQYSPPEEVGEINADLPDEVISVLAATGELSCKL